MSIKFLSFGFTGYLAVIAGPAVAQIGKGSQGGILSALSIPSLSFLFAILMFCGLGAGVWILRTIIDSSKVPLNHFSIPILISLLPGIFGAILGVETGLTLPLVCFIAASLANTGVLLLLVLSFYFSGSDDSI